MEHFIADNLGAHCTGGYVGSFTSAEGSRFCHGERSQFKVSDSKFHVVWGPCMVCYILELSVCSIKLFFYWFVSYFLPNSLFRGITAVNVGMTFIEKLDQEELNKTMQSMQLQVWKNINIKCQMYKRTVDQVLVLCYRWVNIR